MKNSNHFFLKSVLVIVFISIFACSKEEAQLSPSENFSTTVMAMESTFRTTIMASNVYSLYNAATNTFNNHLSGNLPDYESRSKFQTWITANIGKTTFTSVSSAMNEWDAVVGSYADLEVAYSSFYSALPALHQDEYIYVMHAQYAAYRPSTNNLTPCQSDCADQVGANLDFAEELGANFAANPNQAVKAMGKSLVNSYITQSIADFNTCMNAC